MAGPISLTARTALAGFKAELDDEVPGARFTLATDEDLARLDALNADVVENGPPGQIMRQHSTFFASFISSDDGFVVAIEDQSQELIGYTVGSRCSSDRRPFGGQTDEPVDLGQCGLLFGTAIQPNHRGRGLQRICVRLRLKILKEAGCSKAQATAPPTNPKSLINMIRCGFRVIDAAHLLDNQPRYIVEAPCDPDQGKWPPLKPSEDQLFSVLSVDFNQNQTAMKQSGAPIGWHWRDESAKQELSLVYRKPE